MLNRLKKLYPDQAESICLRIEALIKIWKPRISSSYRSIDQSDVCLITYGDSILSESKSSLKALLEFYKLHLSDSISIIHILPFFPYTSDDGFSVVDFRSIDPNLGNWDDVQKLGQQVDLMFDAVINHVSKESDYFQHYLQQTLGYEHFFIDLPVTTDLSLVTRPRTSPLLTPFETKTGVKYVWTTFSDDQVDLNYANPEVLIEVIDVLLYYVHQHARMIRFDAVGFIWKEVGTTCMHHEYAHEIVKLMRTVIERVAQGVKIITETNVKHSENISYFGNGFDEASLVYQFPLPPLVVQAYVSGKSTFLMEWLTNLEPTSSETTFFNFLSSHDGIGLRPLEGIVPDDHKEAMIQKLISRGAKINYRQGPQGNKVPYECCITFTDALSDLHEDDLVRAKRMIGAHVILLSLQGLPAIYIHSLLGSRNDENGYRNSGINRRINREKLSISTIESEISDTSHLRHMIFEGLRKVIKLRKNESLFHPQTPQRTVDFDSDVFAIERYEHDEKLLIIVNVTEKVKHFDLHVNGHDLINNKAIQGYTTIDGFGFGIYKITRNG